MSTTMFRVLAMYYHYLAVGKSVQIRIYSSFNYVYFLLFLKHQGNHTSWEFWGNCQLVFPSKTALLSKAATEACLLVFCGQGKNLYYEAGGGVEGKMEDGKSLLLHENKSVENLKVDCRI